MKFTLLVEQWEKESKMAATDKEGKSPQNETKEGPRTGSDPR